MPIDNFAILDKKITPILKSNGVEFAGVFGSFARGEEKENSDIDLVVRFSPQKRIGLFGFVGIQQDLSDILNRKVDLFTEDGIDKYIREEVAKDLKVLYGQRQAI